MTASRWPLERKNFVSHPLLVSELDLNGLIGGFELNFRCHRLVSWAWARRLIGFIHKNNQSTNGGLSPTALLRLREQVGGRSADDGERRADAVE